MVRLPDFSWTTFDVSGLLPRRWREDLSAARQTADFHEFSRTPVLSREADQVTHIPRGRVHADQVRRQLPWLHQLYRKDFLDLAGRTRHEPVVAADDDRYGLVLNVQQGSGMRFECHVDSNPLTGLLFCSDHDLGHGGELVFAHNPDAAGLEAVDRDCSVIRPQAGHLIFFDGRRNPHYARPLVNQADIRIVAVMNFYTESCPESTRPRELNRHLYGQAERLGRLRRNAGQRRCGRGADGGAAQDGVAGVEDGGLALSDATGGVVQADAQIVVVQPGGAGVHLAVGAELDQAVAGFRDRGAAGPDGAVGGDLADVELLSRADGYRAG